MPFFSFSVHLTKVLIFIAVIHKRLNFSAKLPWEPVYLFVDCPFVSVVQQQPCSILLVSDCSLPMGAMVRY